MQRELVVRAMGGDHHAFTALVDLSLARLYAVSSLILRDGDRAQDAVQDALILAWRDMRSLRNPDAWDAWLHRLTVRCCYQLARRDRRRTVIELQVASDPGEPQVSDLSDDRAERDRVLRELGRLDLDQRAVIVLHYYLDLPIQAVAEVLGIPVGTAKSRLHRGLDELRSSLSAAAEPGVAGLSPERLT